MQSEEVLDAFVKFALSHGPLKGHIALLNLGGKMDPVELVFKCPEAFVDFVRCTMKDEIKVSSHSRKVKLECNGCFSRMSGTASTSSPSIRVSCSTTPSTLRSSLHTLRTTWRAVSRWKNSLTSSWL